MRPLITLASLLLATSLVTCASGEPIDVESSLEALCKNATVAISKISDVRAIIEHLKSGTAPVGCPELVTSYILDLEPVIDDADDVCSMQKVDQIRVYHSKYIQSKTEASGASVPQSLRNFFIGFGFRVNRICKKTMINNLIYDTRSLLTPDDFEQLELWTKNEERFMLKNPNGPADYEDILLAGDLIRLTEARGGPSSNEKVFIQTAASSMLNKIKTVCRRRFKPFYEKLIVPLVSLSNLGYNYRGKELERVLGETKSNKELRQWYEIVYLCQSLDGTELIESKEDQEKTDGLDRKLVRIVTKEEADALRADDDLSMENDDDGLEQIVYKPEGGNPIGDIILDDKDRELNKLIKRFKSNESNLIRIRSKYFSKVRRFLKDKLVGGKLKIKFSSLFKRYKSSNNNNNNNNNNSNNKQAIDVGTTTDPRVEAIRALDEYMQRLMRSDNVDQPVAGFSDFYESAYYHTAEFAKKVYKIIQRMLGVVFIITIGVLFAFIG